MSCSYGYFATNNGYFKCQDASKVDEAFARLRFGSNSVSEIRIDFSLTPPKKKKCKEEGGIEMCKISSANPTA